MADSCDECSAFAQKEKGCQVYNRAFFYRQFIQRDEEVLDIARFLAHAIQRYQREFGGPFPELHPAVSKRLEALDSHARLKEFEDHITALTNQDDVSRICSSYRKSLGGLRVVDAGCGLGRMLPMLSVGLGMTTLGTEPDPEYYAESCLIASGLKEKFQDCIDLRVTQDSFQTLTPEEYYDAIVLIHGGFYYITDFRERLAVLRHLNRCLRPGGILMLDIANFLYHLAFVMPCAERTIIRKSPVGEIKRIISVGVDWHNALWEHGDDFFVEGELKHRERRKFAIIAPPELTYMLEEAGFCNIRTYNGWTSLDPQPIEGPRIIVTAQKQLTT